MSKIFFQKSVFFLLAFLLFSSVCFSEKSYTVTESELNEIFQQTDAMMMQVDELTESVKKLENQRNEYMTLSSELRQENEKLQAKVKTYRYITLGVCSGAIIGGLTMYMMRK